MRSTIFLVLVGCSTTSMGDAGNDASPSDAQEELDASDASPSDASLPCDVSSLPPGAVTCGDWVGNGADDSGAVSCPAAFGSWTTGANSNNGMCTYTWQGSGSPNPCALPGKDGQRAFQWLHPACDGG